MKTQFMALIAAVALTLALPAASVAQTPVAGGSRPVTGRPVTKKPPDVSGMWMPPSDGHHRRFSSDDAPMQPWALALFKANREGITNPYQQGRPQLDPYMYCMPSGIPRSYTAALPFEIVQGAGRIYMIFQTNPLVRYIYTDGRDHPEGFPNTVMGHSIGKWDGDTMVIDTVDIDAATWLDTIGTPHSDALHIVERMRRLNLTTLQIDFLFEDPKAYTKPWTGKKIFHLDTHWEMIPGFQGEDRFHAEFAHKTLRDQKDWIEFSK
jgi:hypothetical protein